MKKINEMIESIPHFSMFAKIKRWFVRDFWESGHNPVCFDCRKDTCPIDCPYRERGKNES